MIIVQYIILLTLIYLVLKNKDKSKLKDEKEKCVYCGNRIDSNFLYCPYCQETIKKKCDSCGKLIYSDWRLCPYCEKENNKEESYYGANRNNY